MVSLEVDKLSDSESSSDELESSSPRKNLGFEVVVGAGVTELGCSTVVVVVVISGLVSTINDENNGKRKKEERVSFLFSETLFFFFYTQYVPLGAGF